MKKLSYNLTLSLIAIVIAIGYATLFSCSKQSDAIIEKTSNSSNILPTPPPPPPPPDPIDLKSKLTQPITVLVDTGCVASYNADLVIDNPASSQLAADFTVGFYTDQRTLLFSVEQINNQPTTHKSQFQTFSLESGQSLSLRLKFSLSGQDFDFNRSYVVTGKIYPKLINGHLLFKDPNAVNDLLTQETLIVSSNTICSKCLETASTLQNVQYSFLIPNSNSSSCENYLAVLYSSATQAELKPAVSKAESLKAYFLLVQNGFIPNTSIKSVLIKNGEGKFLTYNNGVPSFMDQITNDVHGYQKWVVLKPTTTTPCNKHMYKFVQYLNNNTCKELVQIKTNGKYYLTYRSGISRDNIADKFIMEPKSNIIVLPIPPK